MTESKTPKLDAALAKLPKEVLPMWAFYSKADPEDPKPAIKQWAGQIERLNKFVMERYLFLCDDTTTQQIPDHLLDEVHSTTRTILDKSRICEQALRFMLFPQHLKGCEEDVGVAKEKLRELESKRPSGDEEDPELEEKIRETCEQISKCEARSEESLSYDYWKPKTFATL
ncbi:MAG: hypothetical protein Q9168_002061 [Polycauliona sp. 1 TL-2023]